MITEWERGCFYVHILGLTMAMICDSLLSQYNQQPNLIQAHLYVMYKHRCAESTDKKCMLTNRSGEVYSTKK